ncbi:MAG: transglutaminase family protein [Pseudomonadota bacterium]|nr:transglutaminase family protein [Pseudomonadota bacterium]
MAIRAALHHRTSYRFDRPVQVFPHEIRLRPAAHTRTPIANYSLRIEPAGHFLNWQQDGYGNWVARVVFPELTSQMSVEVDLHADLTVINPFDFFVEDYAERFPFSYRDQLRGELAPFLECEPAGAALSALVDAVHASLPAEGLGINDFLVSVNRQVQAQVAYTIRLEPGVQAPDLTLEKHLGSCRDSAWLMVQLMRHLGLAARFVSGYLIQLSADVKPLEGPAGPASDFTDLHAWAEVYVPGAGWVGLDATSGLLAAEGHIPLAATAHYRSAAPVIGATGKCEVEFEFAMHVDRVLEDPRVTKPYTDEQWQEIDALGEQVERDLQTHDVRLTQGGEPTFVSIDDMEGAEWNTDALGQHKRRLAGELLHRLRARFGPGGVLHHGLGKWYPGEPLPRWALDCYWRRDGEPLWLDDRLIAEDHPRSSLGSDAVARFAAALATQLKLPQERFLSAWEDPLVALREESQLPVDMDLSAARLEDGDERKRLVRLLEQGGLTRPAGLVMPLRPAPRLDPAQPTTWQSGPWPTRRPRLYLVPGDSPIGLRLPLHSLPLHRGPAGDIGFFMADPFAPRAALPPALQHPAGAALAADAGVRGASDPAWNAWTLQRGKPADAVAGTTNGPGVDPGGAPLLRHPELPPLAQRQPHPALLPGQDVASGTIVTTALCLEARGDILHVFLPPLPCLEDWVRLVQAIELAARALDQPVRLEGYTPPHDPRLRRLAVTPDPGVIEVNVHPAGNWQELRGIVTELYAEARQTRLSTEKFMLDGRHTGTGGGNHVTLGGWSPADSPLLRRPDLLRSLLTYWQNHPGLSYVFCGQFIGPTSQSPRVDEARDDNLHELEIAFAEMDRVAPAGGTCAPWITDRLLRHLLTDLTGNTHRAEFSIDKLYSPDGPTGRLGLLEFRAFEMPPHERMSLVQLLLLRALVAKFWREPYRAPLVRWNTELHDRFMLPHFVQQDLNDVLRDLGEAGYLFDPRWFEPFLEFRFPRYGTASYDGVTVELRQAIEPWHVLGEEMSGHGTARYVDSAVERLQVKVSGMVGERHWIRCNGLPLPLVPSGTRGEFVAGVRFKAWNPPSSLHPTVAAHGPLVFDLVDGWNRRSMGGCTYHVAHPGGRSYDIFPVNANEAEARRFGRFQAQGHTPGRILGRSPVRDRDFPCTLDLRTWPRDEV